MVILHLNQSSNKENLWPRRAAQTLSRTLKSTAKVTARAAVSASGTTALPMNAWLDVKAERKKKMFEVYLDGCPIRIFDTEAEAEQWCAMYDGDKTPSYEKIAWKELNYASSGKAEEWHNR